MGWGAINHTAVCQRGNVPVMNQSEMFRKPKPRYCCWLYLAPARVCKARAVGMIHRAPYCAEHGLKAEKLFGPFKLFAPTI